MRIMTKLFGLAVLGAGIYAGVRAAKRVKLERGGSFDFDVSDIDDLDTPVVVSEEVVVISELEPYDVEMIVDMGRSDTGVPSDEQAAQRVEMPGRDAGPR